MSRIRQVLVKIRKSILPDISPPVGKPRLDAEWFETFLACQSDGDARWYYERRSWDGFA